MSEPLYVSEEKVKSVLTWDFTFSAIETALASVAQKRAIQNPRSFTQYKSDSVLLTMPGYLQSEELGSLGCKLVTLSPNNAKLHSPLPIVNAYVTLFDESTGVLKAIIAGNEITKWRTAAASAIATNYLTKSKKFDILAILGAGDQGRIHAIAFQYFFDLTEIRIWNRNLAKAQDLVSEMNKTYNSQKFKFFQSNEECVREADVVITATFADKPIVQREWLKEGAHINAIGAGLTHHSELSESIYLSSNIYIDHRAGAEIELAGLLNLGVEFKGEIGALIAGELSPPRSNEVSVFQSLGMAVEDCAMARIVYDLCQN